MKNIKLSLTALALSALLTACPATGSDRPEAGNGGETPTNPTTPADPATPTTPTTPTTFSLEGTVQEYVVSEGPSAIEYTAVPRVWSAGAQPLYAQAMRWADAAQEAPRVEKLATGSISEAGVLNVTLPGTVPDTVLGSPDYTDSLWKNMTPEELLEGLTCTNSVDTSDKNADAKMAAITLGYGAPEETSPLLLEGRLPSASVTQQGDAVTTTQKTNWVFFVYTTKDVTISGTQNCHGTQGLEGYAAQVDYSSDINLDLQRGWNQVRYEFETTRMYNTENGTISQKSKVHAINDSSAQWYVAADTGVATPLHLPTTAPTLR